MHRALRSRALWALSFLLFLPTIAASQEGKEKKPECRLDRSDEVLMANEALQEARVADPEKAVELYEEALSRLETKLREKDGAALLLAAQANVGLRKYEQADAELDEFLVVAPGCADPAHNVRYNAWAELYNSAIEAFRNGDQDRALELFRLANVIYTDARSLNNTAYLHKQRGETEEAIEAYRHAAESDGDPEQVRMAVMSLAEMLEEAGRTEEAGQMYQNYLASHPDDVLIKIDYGAYLVENGEAEKGNALIEEAFGQAELSGREWNVVGVDLYNAEQNEKAAEAFRRAHAANPEDKDALENLVTALVETEQYEEAVPLARALVERFPYDDFNYQLLATSLANTDQGREALATIQQSEELPFTLESLQLQSLGEGEWVVSGLARARAAAASSTVVVPFEFLGPNGEVLATAEASIELPAVDETRRFEVRAQVGDDVAGFRYRKTGTPDA